MKRGVRIGLFCALAVIGAACLLYGVFAGQVLNKASRVCLECIGIG